MKNYIKAHILFLFSCIACCYQHIASASLNFNMTPGVTAISQDIYQLHMVIFWICVFAGILVFGVMAWAIFFHRKSRGHKAAQFHENIWVEVIWTLIPLLILIAMAIPATKTLLHIYDADDADIDIKITGYQWKWQYEYLNEGVSFFSNLATSEQEIYGARIKNPHYLLDVDEPLVVPTNKKIRFLITSADVIHAWWVPALAIKKDGIPGFMNEAWTRIESPGVYRGQCAELCGKNHGFMPIVLEAKSDEEYKNWLKVKKEEAEKIKALTSKDWSFEELYQQGETVYNRVCVACHQSNGQGLPPTFPSLVKTQIATDERFIADHINVVVHGVKNSAMQAFGNQLNEIDLAAVITYERNAWGNQTKNKITPKDIIDFKKTGTYHGQEPSGKYTKGK